MSDEQNKDTDTNESKETLVLNQILESDDPTAAISELAFGMKSKILSRKRKDPKKSRQARANFKKNKAKIMRGRKKFAKSSAGKANQKKLAKFNRGKSKNASYSGDGQKMLEQLHTLLFEGSVLFSELSELQLNLVREGAEDASFDMIDEVLTEMSTLSELNSDLTSAVLNGFNENADTEDVQGLIDDVTEFISDYGSEETND